jgi:hypothetical protein
MPTERIVVVVNREMRYAGFPFFPGKVILAPDELPLAVARAWLLNGDARAVTEGEKKIRLRTCRRGRTRDFKPGELACVPGEIGLDEARWLVSVGLAEVVRATTRRAGSREIRSA